MKGHSFFEKEENSYQNSRPVPFQLFSSENHRNPTLNWIEYFPPKEGVPRSNRGGCTLSKRGAGPDQLSHFDCHARDSLRLPWAGADDLSDPHCAHNALRCATGSPLSKFHAPWPSAGDGIFDE